MKLKGESKIILGSILFSLIPICVKFDPNNSVYSLLFGRLLFASLFLFLLKRSISYYTKITLKDLLLLLIWSAIMFGAMVFYFLAINISGVALSSSLLGAQPVIIILLAILFLKEKITIQTIGACALTLVGIYLICDFSSFSFTSAKSGQLLAIGSASLLALNFVFQKKYLSHLSSDKLVFYQSLFQLPLLVPFLISEPPKITSNFMLATILLGVFCTVAAYRLIYSGAKEVSAQKIGVLQSIEYVMPVGFGILFYHEKLDITTCIGVVLILSSTILVNLKPTVKSAA